LGGACCDGPGALPPLARDCIRVLAVRDLAFALSDVGLISLDAAPCFATTAAIVGLVRLTDGWLLMSDSGRSHFGSKPPFGG
jgi:hypothetical protein